MTCASIPRSLTPDDRRKGFIKATSNMSGAADRWRNRAASGLSDAQLAEALAYEIGIMGGSSGPGSIWLSYKSAGLKIWISWDFQSMNQTKPTFEGRTTIAMARHVYAIKDPADIQLAMF